MVAAIAAQPGMVGEMTLDEPSARAVAVVNVREFAAAAKPTNGNPLACVFYVDLHSDPDLNPMRTAGAIAGSGQIRCIPLMLMMPDSLDVIQTERQ